MASIIKCTVRSCQFAEPVKGHARLSTCKNAIWAGASLHPTVKSKCDSYFKSKGEIMVKRTARINNRELNNAVKDNLMGFLSREGFNFRNLTRKKICVKSKKGWMKIMSEVLDLLCGKKEPPLKDFISIVAKYRIESKLKYKMIKRFVGVFVAVMKISGKNPKQMAESGFDFLNLK